MSKEHCAILISRSQISGEHTHIIENGSLIGFYAQIVGSVQGLTAAGAVVVSLTLMTEGAA